MSNKKKNSGSSLIEVLIAIVVVGLVVTGAMISISYSVRNSAEARYREVGSQLAQDGMEVVKLRRELEQWTDFYNLSDTTYCLGDNVITLTAGASCDVTNSNKQYTRFVELSQTAGSPQTVTAKVTVEWTSESGQTMNVEITQEFKERIL